MIHLWDRYWAWVGGNVGAMPLQFIITLIAGVAFRKPISRLIAWVKRESREELAEARQDAKAALKIVADLFEHHTGEAHPDAPARPEEER